MPYQSEIASAPEEVGRASFTIIIVYGANQTYGEVYKKQDVLLLFLAK